MIISNFTIKVLGALTMEFTQRTKMELEQKVLFMIIALHMSGIVWKRLNNYNDVQLKPPAEGQILQSKERLSHYPTNT